MTTPNLGWNGKDFVIGENLYIGNTRVITQDGIWKGQFECINLDNNLSVSSYLHTDSILNVNDNALLNKNLSVKGDTNFVGKISVNDGYFSKHLSVNDSVNIDKALFLKGDLSLGGNLIINNILEEKITTITDEVLFENYLIVNENVELKDTLSVTKLTNIDDGLSVKGKATIDDEIIGKSTLSIAGSGFLEQNLSVDCDINLGNNAFVEIGRAHV